MSNIILHCSRHLNCFVNYSSLGRLFQDIKELGRSLVAPILFTVLANYSHLAAGSRLCLAQYPLRNKG